MMAIVAGWCAIVCNRYARAFVFTAERKEGLSARDQHIQLGMTASDACGEAIEAKLSFSRLSLSLVCEFGVQYARTLGWCGNCKFNGNLGNNTYEDIKLFSRRTYAAAGRKICN